MKQMTQAAVERAMKLQDVMLRGVAKRITWFQAAEILGTNCRQMQRWHCCTACLWEPGAL
jgi:hypothetical protein